jgi:hypothetical protein
MYRKALSHRYIYIGHSIIKVALCPIYGTYMGIFRIYIYIYIYIGDSILKVALSERIMRESGFGGGEGGGGGGLKVRDMSVRRAMLENNELLGLVALKEWRIARGIDSEKSHVCPIYGA